MQRPLYRDDGHFLLALSPDLRCGAGVFLISICVMGHTDVVETAAQGCWRSVLGLRGPAGASSAGGDSAAAGREGGGGPWGRHVGLDPFCDSGPSTRGPQARLPEVSQHPRRARSRYALFLRVLPCVTPARTGERGGKGHGPGVLD